MENNKNEGRSTSAQNNKGDKIEGGTFEKQTIMPKGADEMNESYSNPPNDNHQKGDSSFNANTSDNES